MKYRKFGNTGLEVSELPDLSEDMMSRLQDHSWNRGFWYGGK